MMQCSRAVPAPAAGRLRGGRGADRTHHDDRGHQARLALNDRFFLLLPVAIFWVSGVPEQIHNEFKNQLFVRGVSYRECCQQ
jgi:hypothetical protein